MSATATMIEEIASRQSAGGIKNKANYIQAETRDLEDAQAHKETASALSSLQDQVNKLVESVRAIASFVSQSGVLGAAGGDLSGTYPDPTVSGLQTVPIDPSAPTTGDVLGFDGAQWTPTTPSVTPGAATIDYVTISGATVISASVMPPPTNGLLRVFITFTVAIQPSWDASDFSIPPGALATAVGTTSVVCFCADGSGKWAMEAPPVTNR